MFQNLNQLAILNSVLHGIDDRLFESFNKINKIGIVILNLVDFFKNGTTWLKSINCDLTVDLNNPDEIQQSQNRQVVFFSLKIKPKIISAVRISRRFG